MEQNHIPLHKTHVLSSLIVDYLKKSETLKPFYNRFPDINNYISQIENKEEQYSSESRAVLVKALTKQYKGFKVSENTKAHIELLSDSATYTITTGHQLNIFTGPLYFIYKICSTILLAKELKANYPDYNFVPVYWMATEDHDFDEINFLNFESKKFEWKKNAKGAVGALSTEGLNDFFDFFSKALGESKNATYLKDLFSSSYLNHKSLADATRFLVNKLFKAYGLVIIDGNDNKLKKLFAPYMVNELTKNLAYKSVSKTNKELYAKSYKIQVTPREINLFYLKENLRERIVLKNKKYKVLNTDIVWTEGELLEEVANYPERFSPNVIMRPLYQEVVLPNLCYIGGGGELAYWLQLKRFFESQQVPFPMLLLRNSVVIKTRKQSQKLKKLNISDEELFLTQDNLVNKKIKALSDIEIDLSLQKEHLKNQFSELYKIAEQTDKSFIGAVKAQEKKQLNGLDKLEKRLLKAQKRKHSEQVREIKKIHNELFPNQSLQERYNNFSEYYLRYGEQFIPHLLDNLKPLKQDFFLLTI